MKLEEPTQVGSFVNIKGARIFYRSVGSGNPIVLLHGFPTSSYDWRHFLEPLSKFGRVIAPDLYGFGYSEAPNEANLSTFISEFVSAMGIGRSILAGYDVGGVLSLAHAIENPAAASGLVIMNTPAYPDWVDHARNSRSYATARRLMKSSLYRGVGLLMLNQRKVHSILAHVSGANIAEEDLGQQLFFFRRGIKRLAAMRPRAYTEDFFKDAELLLGQLSGRIKELKVPTLIVFGKDDSFIPAGTAERLHRDIQGSTIHILEGTGHFLLEECPEKVVSLIKSFLIGMEH